MQEVDNFTTSELSFLVEKATKTDKIVIPKIMLSPGHNHLKDVTIQIDHDEFTKDVAISCKSNLSKNSRHDTFTSEIDDRDV